MERKMDDVGGLYAEAVIPALYAITRAKHLARKIAEARREDILEAQLVPGMFNCRTQLRTVGIFALRSTFTLIGRDWPHDMLGEGFAEGVEGLVARLELAERQINELPEAAFADAGTRQITHKAGQAFVTQPGDLYLRLFALPNLWFHLSMAYAIARREGLEIGKGDYDGWHSYAPEFRFVS